MIKVLIVEDSKVAGEFLKFILNADSDIEVIGFVHNGRQAIEFLKHTKPDVITMDIDMPVMNGLEATRYIMSTTAVPILIVTGSRNANEVQTSIEALSAGALSVIQKPYGVNHPREEESIRKLVIMVKLMAEVKVVTHRSLKIKKSEDIQLPVRELIASDLIKRKKIVAIGVSTGGPNVLKQIFSKISRKFPLPIVVVQHISEGFLVGLVNWLSGTNNIGMSIAKHNEILTPGHVYFAPDNSQMTVNAKGIVKLSNCEEGAIICPSVTNLFESLAKEYGSASIALLLTGMGSDGSHALKELRNKGALTIAQDMNSSMVYGMPGVAVKLDAADLILNPMEIAELLFSME